MTDTTVDKQEKKEAVQSHMSQLRTLSNQTPWWNFACRGMLASKHGMYSSWWQMGVSIVLSVALVLFALWAMNEIAQTAQTYQKSIVDKSVNIIDDLKDQIKILEAEQSELSKELEDCRNGVTTKAAVE